MVLQVQNPGLKKHFAGGGDQLYIVTEQFFLSLACLYSSAKIIYWHWPKDHVTLSSFNVVLIFTRKKKKKVVNGNRALKVVSGTVLP